MRHAVVHALVLAALVASVAASEPEYFLDSNTAFYEGASVSYVIAPPAEFKLVVDRALDDGYSMAFIPEHDSYDSASVMITATFYRLTENTFDEILTADTIALREHYDPKLIIRPVDSVFLFSGDPIKTYYVDDKTRFIPTVMVSYYDSGDEILIFELTISASGLPRFLAERVYTSFLERVKVLKKGTLEPEGS